MYASSKDTSHVYTSNTCVYIECVYIEYMCTHRKIHLMCIHLQKMGVKRCIVQDQMRLVQDVYVSSCTGVCGCVGGLVGGRVCACVCVCVCVCVCLCDCVTV